MQSTLSPQQMERVLRRTPIPTKPQTAKTVATCHYDPDLLDEPLENMFGRRWDDMDVFPPRAKEIWSALFGCTIGRVYTLDEVAMLLAVAENTRSESLRRRAIGGLKDHLADCSGTNLALKPAAQKLLNRLLNTPKEPDETLDTPNNACP